MKSRQWEQDCREHFINLTNILRERKYEVFEKILLRKNMKFKEKILLQKSSKKFAVFFKFTLAIAEETPSRHGSKLLLHFNSKLMFYLLTNQSDLQWFKDQIYKDNCQLIVPVILPYIQGLYLTKPFFFFFFFFFN